MPGDAAQRKMEHGHVGVSANLPAHQDSAKAVHPGVGTLDQPTTRLLPCPTLQLLRLLTARTNVSSESELLSELTDLVVVVALVEAQVLPTFRRSGSLNRDALDGFSRKFEVVPVGTVGGETDGDAPALHEDAALGPQLGPARGVRPRLFPPRVVPSSSHHPSPTIASRCLSIHRRPRGPASRTPRTRPRPSILETAGMPMSNCRSPSRSVHSTGTRYAVRRGSRSWPPGRAPAVYGIPGGAWGAPAAAAPLSPRVRPVCANHRP